GMASRALSTRFISVCSSWPPLAVTRPSPGSSLSTMSMRSPRIGCSVRTTPAAIAFRSSEVRAGAAARLDASMCWVRLRPHTAALRIDSAPVRSGSVGSIRLSISSLYPVMTARMLLKSWATPPARRPTASSRRASRRSSSSRRPRTRSCSSSWLRRSASASASGSVTSCRFTAADSPGGKTSPKVVAMRPRLRRGIREERQHDAKDGPAADGIAEVDAAAVVLDDLVGQRQSETGPPGLGAEEGIEHTVGVGGWNADAGVLDLDAHPAGAGWRPAPGPHEVVVVAPAHPQREVSPGGHGVERVAHEVDQRLVDRLGVDPD